MTKKNYTYRLARIASQVLLWELIFWSTAYLLLLSLGYFGGSGGEQLIFVEPAYLNLHYLLIPLVLFFFYRLYRYNTQINPEQLRVISSYLRPPNQRSVFLRYLFFRNAMVFLIFALAQPAFGKKKVSGISETMELVVCLDISNSMNTRDISKEISRLEIAKRALSELFNNLHGERIGLCLFANDAFVQLPVTRDYNAAKLFIQEIETNMISSQGTNVDAALQTALEMFSKEQIPKAVLLITDGENHEDDPSETLARLKENRIGFSVLGIGTKAGGLVPKDPDRPELGYKTSGNGRPVESRLNEAFLKDLALKGGGAAHLSTSEFPDLRILLTQINHMKRMKSDNFEFEIHESRYQLPLGAAVVFWILFLIWYKNPRLLVAKKDAF